MKNLKSISNDKPHLTRKVQYLYNYSDYTELGYNYSMNVEPQRNIIKNPQVESNIKFLKFYLNSFEMHYAGEMAAIKDLESKYIAATPEYANLIGFESSVGLVLNGYARADSHSGKYVDEFFEQDRLAEKSNKQIYCLDNIEYNNGFESLLFKKKPIINPDTNNVVGIFLLAQKPLVISPLNIHLLMHESTNKSRKHSVIGNFKPNNIKLTARQHLILFLAIHNYSSGKISQFFTQINENINIKTVNAALDVLKIKFDVDSKEKLVQEAINCGFHLQIPKILLKEGSFLIKNHEFQIKK